VDRRLHAILDATGAPNEGQMDGEAEQDDDEAAQHVDDVVVGRQDDGRRQVPIGPVAVEDQCHGDDHRPVTARKAPPRARVDRCSR
jgi:hypothetical protein